MLCELREQLFSHLEVMYIIIIITVEIKNEEKIKQETIKNIIRSERNSLQHAIFLLLS